jgi:hypothetical protein
MATSGGERFPEGVAGTFLPIMNGYHEDFEGVFRGARRGQNKNIENNPMQSKKKAPNLIPR